MSDKKLTPQQVDQECAALRDMMPRLWWAIYMGSLDTGFTKGQALALLQTWILAQNPNGIRPPTDQGFTNTSDKD